MLNLRLSSRNIPVVLIKLDMTLVKKIIINNTLISLHVMVLFDYKRTYTIYEVNIHKIHFL